MKKYLYIIKASLKKSLEFRWNLVIGLISRLMAFLVLSNFWQAIYSESEDLKSYLITYSLISILYSDSIDVRLGRYISDNIIYGDLSSHLLKPINTLLFYFFSNLGEAIVNILVSSIIFVSLSFTNASIEINRSNNSLNLILGAAAALLGYLLYSQFHILGSTSTFWLQDNKFFNFFMEKFVKFLGGGKIPISAFFPLLQKVALLLPFSLSIYLPVSLLLDNNQYANPLLQIGKQLIWLFILTILIKLLWQRGLLKYEAQGQ